MEKKTFVLICIVVLLLLVVWSMCGDTSGFQKSGTDPKISSDTVVIFFAPWCGHCKSAKPEFEKAVKHGGGKVVMIDATLPENKKLTETYGVSGFPTIMKGGKTHDGGRTEKDILLFADTA